MATRLISAARRHLVPTDIVPLLLLPAAVLLILILHSVAP